MMSMATARDRATVQAHACNRCRLPAWWQKTPQSGPMLVAGDNRRAARPVVLRGGVRQARRSAGTARPGPSRRASTTSAAVCPVRVRGGEAEPADIALGGLGVPGGVQVPAVTHARGQMTLSDQGLSAAGAQVAAGALAPYWQGSVTAVPNGHHVVSASLRAGQCEVSGHD